MVFIKKFTLFILLSIGAIVILVSPFFVFGERGLIANAKYKKQLDEKLNVINDLGIGNFNGYCRFTGVEPINFGAYGLSNYDCRNKTTYTELEVTKKFEDIKNTLEKSGWVEKNYHDGGVAYIKDGVVIRIVRHSYDFERNDGLRTLEVHLNIEK